MSADDPPEVDREELIEQAKATRAEEEAKHEALLEAAASGEEAVLTEYETVSLGDTEITAETQIPGAVMRKLDAIYDGDVSPGEGLDVYVDVLTEQTERIEAGEVAVEREADIRQFWRRWLDTNDVMAAAELALERVIEEPNELEQERREEAVRSFRNQR